MNIQMFECRFKANLGFFEKRHNIGSPLEKKFKDWQYDAVTLKFFDVEKKISSSLECKQINLISLNQDQSEFKTFVKLVCDSYFKEIDIQEIVRCGYRQISSIETKMTFGEAVSLFEDRIYPKNNAFKKIFTDSFDDVAFFGDFSKNSLLFHVMSGPVKKNECIERFKKSNPFDIDPEKVADTSLFVDIDAYKENFQKKDLDDVFNKALQNVSEIQDGLVKFTIE